MASVKPSSSHRLISAHVSERSSKSFRRRLTCGCGRSQPSTKKQTNKSKDVKGTCWIYWRVHSNYSNYTQSLHITCGHIMRIFSMHLRFLSLFFSHVNPQNLSHIQGRAVPPATCPTGASPPHPDFPTARWAAEEELPPQSCPNGHMTHGAGIVINI